MDTKKRAVAATTPGRRPLLPGPAWLAAVLIAVAACAVYANGLSIPFVLDDEATVVQNADIRQLSDLWRVLLPTANSPTAGRPLASLSFAINYAIGGLDPRGYHVVNLMLHVVCAWLLFGIVRRTLASPPWSARLQADATPIALTAALVWVVHPLTSEVVNYVTQRTEALAAVWILSTLYAVRRWHEVPASRWDLAALACAMLGVLSKETAVVTPVLVALYDRAFLSTTWRVLWRTHASLYLGLIGSWFVLAALLWSGPRAAVGGFSAGIEPWTYLLNQAAVILDYLRLSAWPVRLVAFWGWPLPLTFADVWLPFGVVAALAVGAVAWFIAVPRLGFCLLCFFVTLAPTSSIVPIATEVGADRRMYLPLAALITLAVTACWHTVTGAARKQRGPRDSIWPTRLAPARDLVGDRSGLLLAVPAVVLVAALGWATVTRNREYATPLALAQTIVDRRPTAVAHQILGEQLVLANRPVEANAELRQAVALGDTRALYPLGVLILTLGDVAGAVPHFERVVELAGVTQRLKWLEPPLVQVLSARLALSEAYAGQRRWADAEAQARQVLARVPGHLNAGRMLGTALVGQQRWAEAITVLQLYLSVRPGDMQAHTNLGIALASGGRLNDAVAEFRRAVSIDPQNPSAQRLLQMALQEAEAKASTTAPEGR